MRLGEDFSLGYFVSTINVLTLDPVKLKPFSQFEVDFVTIVDECMLVSFNG